MVNDFRQFGGAMAKLSVNTNTIERANGKAAALRDQFKAILQEDLLR